MEAGSGTTSVTVEVRTRYASPEEATLIEMHLASALKVQAPTPTRPVVLFRVTASNNTSPVASAGFKETPELSRRSKFKFRIEAIVANIVESPLNPPITAVEDALPPKPTMEPEA